MWACDFLQTYDIWFRPIFAFFIIGINTKEVVHCAVTRAPTQQWTTQQLRNVTPFGHGPKFIIRDRDNKFGASFDRVAKGSVRRECLDHVIVLSERHLFQLLREYSLDFFNRARPHQGWPNGSPVAGDRALLRRQGDVIAIPVLGGLHHRYRNAA